METFLPTAVWLFTTVRGTHQQTITIPTAVWLFTTVRGTHQLSQVTITVSLYKGVNLHEMFDILHR